MTGESVRDANDTFDELLRVHQLNIELLEQLDVIARYILKKNIDIPNRSTLLSLTRKAQSLLNEICTSPKLQHRKRTPKDSTEPVSKIHAVCLTCLPKIANHKINNPLANPIAIHKQKRHKNER